MRVTYKDGIYSISELTQEQLGIIRYALNEGTEKLEQTARFLKALNGKATSSLETALAAREANDALEAAVQACVY